MLRGATWLTLPGIQWPASGFVPLEKSYLNPQLLSCILLFNEGQLLQSQSPPTCSLPRPANLTGNTLSCFLSPSLYLSPTLMIFDQNLYYFKSLLNCPFGIQFGLFPNLMKNDLLSTYLCVRSYSIMVNKRDMFLPLWGLLFKKG